MIPKNAQCFRARKFEGLKLLELVSAHGSPRAPTQMYERSPFFPSMEVKAASAETFSNANWIKGSFRKQKTGVIASTRPSEVLVAWVAALQVFGFWVLGFGVSPPRIP